MEATDEINLHYVSDCQIDLIKDQIGIFEGCSINHNEEGRKLVLMGNEQAVNNKREHILFLFSQIQQECIELSPKQKQILHSEKGTFFLNKNLTDCLWHIVNMELTVVSKTKTMDELYHIVVYLKSTIESASFEKEISRIVSHDHVENTLELKYDGMSLEGVNNNVSSSALDPVLKGVDTHEVVTETFIIDETKTMFINGHNLLKDLYALFSGIKFINHPHSQKIIIETTLLRSQLETLRKQVDIFCDSIVSSVLRHNFTNQELYLITQGKEKYNSVQDRIKTFERYKHCSVIFPISGSNITSNQDSSSHDIVQNVSENCKLFIKQAQDITSENADVLVCPIQKDMKRTAVFERLTGMCKGMHEELENEFEKDKSADLFVTSHSLGNLHCSSVIFVILKPFNKQDASNSIRYLEQQITKILQKADSINASSISFPVMGYGRAFQFPADAAAKAAVHGVESFFKSSQSQNITSITFLTPQEEINREFQHLLAFNSSSPTKANHMNKGIHIIAKISPKSKEFFQLQSDLNAVFTKVCLQSEDFIQDILDEFPKGMHLEIKKKAKQFGIWLERTQHKKTQKCGYAVRGAKEGRKKMLKVIHLNFNTVSNKFPKTPIRGITKPKRGSKEYMKVAASSDEKFPSYWSLNTMEYFLNQGERNTPQPKKVPVGKGTFNAIKALVHKTWDGTKVGNGADARNLNHSRIKVIKVERLESLMLFDKYRLSREHLLQKRSSKGACDDIARLKSKDSLKSDGGVSTTAALPDFMKTELLCLEVNEHYLFHGCKQKVLDEILEQGFDPRLASEGGMLGKAIYFAESSTKSDQYSDNQDSRVNKGTKLTIILARVLLGNPFLCGKKYLGGKNSTKLKRPPCKKCTQDMCDCKNKKYYDSVIAQEYLFREFVVYGGDVCYPEYIITYVRE